MTEPFIHPMPVRFADTDAQGHVYFANYLTFCDEAFAAYMRHIGYPWQEMVEDGVDMFYRAAKCDYRGSARFEDVVGVEARVARIGRSSVVTAYRMRGPDGEVIAEAELVSVCVDVERREPVPAPARLRDAVAAAQGAP